MKSMPMFLSVLLCGMLTFGPTLRAATPSACKNIKTACEAAGYARGKHPDGKALGADCMKPILAGQTVSGVTVNPADVQACQAQRGEQGKKRSQKPANKPLADPSPEQDPQP